MRLAPRAVTGYIKIKLKSQYIIITKLQRLLKNIKIREVIYLKYKKYLVKKKECLSTFKKTNFKMSRIRGKRPQSKNQKSFLSKIYGQ